MNPTNTTDDVARLVDLDRAFTDAALTLGERAQNGTDSRFDAAALTAIHDALDASLMAFRAAHYPDARHIAITPDGVVIVQRDGKTVHLTINEGEQE